MATITRAGELSPPTAAGASYPTVYAEAKRAVEAAEALGVVLNVG